MIIRTALELPRDAPQGSAASGPRGPDDQRDGVGLAGSLTPGIHRHDGMDAENPLLIGQHFDRLPDWGTLDGAISRCDVGAIDDIQPLFALDLTRDPIDGR